MADWRVVQVDGFCRQHGVLAVALSRNNQVTRHIGDQGARRCDEGHFERFPRTARDLGHSARLPQSGGAEMLLCMFMCMSDDHSQMPTHAHINVLGWASMALYGVVYRAWPEAAHSPLAPW